MADAIEIEGVGAFRSAMLGLSRASAPKVRKALAKELIEVRNAMRTDAGENMESHQKGASDFKKSIKSFVFYRKRSDISLDEVGGAAKAYGDFWIAHETGAVITRGADKWLLIVLPAGFREYGGKKKNKRPYGTIIRKLNDDMLGVFRPMKRKIKLIAILKKVVTLQARLSLIPKGKRAARSIARNLVNEITLG